MWHFVEAKEMFANFIETRLNKLCSFPRIHNKDVKSSLAIGFLGIKILPLSWLKQKRKKDSFDEFSDLMMNLINDLSYNILFVQFVKLLWKSQQKELCKINNKFIEK